MKSKIFGLMGLSIFVLVLFVSLVSAEITFSDAPTLEQDGDSFTITVTTNETETINFSATTIEDSDGDQIIFTDLDDVDFTADESQEVEISYSVDADFDFDFEEEYSTILTAEGNVPTEDATHTLYFEKIFCDEDNPANIEVGIDKIDVTEGFGDDEDFWYPLDEIEIDVEVKDPDYDVENLEIEFCLYDVDDEKCILDEGDIDISEDEFDVDEGDDLTTTLSFKIDPDDLNAGDKDYIIYVKATGTIDDKDAPEDKDGEKTCSSDSQDIEIRTDEKFVIIDDIRLSKETVQCGEELKITADVWNVGDEDLKDDEVFVRVLNTDLDIDEKITFSNGIDYMDKEELELSVQIPEGLDEQFYTIKMIVYDDEDMDDNDIYENDEEDQAEYRASVEVEGNCGVSGGVQAIVAATLETGGKAGEEMIVKATITNTGDDSSVYTVNVAGYTDWASSASADKTTLSLAKGESGNVMITFDVKSDASGSETFDIELISDNQLVIKQPVTVSIEGTSGFDLLGSIRNNTILWAIGALNAILVIAIIFVAIRLVTKS